MSVLLLLGMLTGFVSPEQTVGTPTVGVGLGAQYLPVISFDGSRYLLSWHDHRNGPGGEAYAARYDLAGTALDPTPLRLTAQSQDSDTWGALYDGTNHVVAHLSGGRVALSRVSPQGVVLDPTPIIASGGDVHSFPSIAFDGTNYLVVWTDGRNYPYDVYGARVSKAGVVLDVNGIGIATGPGFETNPDVTFDGTNFVVVWQEGTSVVAGAKVTPGGAVLPRSALANAAALKNPRVAGHQGAPTLVTYLDGPPGGMRVKAMGYGPPAMPAFPLGASDVDDEHQVQVVWDGAQYVVVWADERGGTMQPAGARISTGLTALDPGGKRLVTTPGYAYAPAIAAGVGGYLLAFLDDRAGVAALYTTRLDVGLNAATPAGNAVLKVADAQDRASLVAAGGRLLAAFEAWHHTLPNAEMVNLATPLAPQKLGATGKKQQTPSLAVGDGVVLAVWSEEEDLLGRRFSPDGTPIDAAPFPVCDDSASKQLEGSATFDGTDFVVAWRDGRSGNGGFAIWARHLPVAGPPPAGCGFLVSNLAGDNQAPKLAGRAGTTVVAWSGDTGGVRAARIQGTAVLDATPLALDTGKGVTPVVAAGAADFVVAWRDPRRGSYDLFATRLNATGPAVDGQGLGLVVAPSGQELPSIAFDGARYLLAWNDDRRGKPDVYATFVSSTLQVASPFGFAISASDEEDDGPSVAALGPGRFGVAFTRFDAKLGSRRLGVRTFTELPQGATGCTLDAECGTGFCAGGVCCGSACGGGCQTCATGTCALLLAGTACRPAASTCDAPETCDGAAAACPPDVASPDGLLCAGGVCEAGVCQTGDAPRFAGPPAVQLTCGEAWRYSRAGTPEVTGKGPFTFSARMADGSPLPDGFTLDAASGEMGWTPAPGQVGAVTLELKVTNADGFDTELVVFDVECAPRKYQAGCAAVDLQPWLLAAALLVLFSAARRRPSPVPARSRGSSSSRTRRR